MTLKAWVHENANLYLAGKDKGNEALSVSAQDALNTANETIAEAEGFKKLRLMDLHRFETLWVAPEAFDEENWSDDQWAKVNSREADEHYAKQGWVPVLTIGLEEEN